MNEPTHTDCSDGEECGESSPTTVRKVFDTPEYGRHDKLVVTATIFKSSGKKCISVGENPSVIADTLRLCPPADNGRLGSATVSFENVSTASTMVFAQGEYNRFKRFVMENKGVTSVVEETLAERTERVLRE